MCNQLKLIISYFIDDPKLFYILNNTGNEFKNYQGLRGNRPKLTECKNRPWLMLSASVFRENLESFSTEKVDHLNQIGEFPRLKNASKLKTIIFFRAAR